MGSDQDFQQMLQFVDEHKLTPVVDQMYPLSKGNAAIESMRDSSQFGKIVLQIS